MLLPTMLPKSRLGKRSPLGALVCTSCPSMESPLETGSHGDPEGGVGGPTMGSPGPQHLSRFNYKLQPGQKVRERGHRERWGEKGEGGRERVRRESGKGMRVEERRG